MAYIGGFALGFTGVKIALFRAVTVLLSTTIGNLLMLIIMTFNVGIFLSIVFGYAFGTFLFFPVAQVSIAGKIGNTDIRVMPSASCCQ